MRVILNLLRDPYLHVIGIGLLLVGLASRADDESRRLREDLTAPYTCEVCRQAHRPGNECPVRVLGTMALADDQ